MLVDDLDDALLRALAAWPIRLYGVRGGVLELIGQPEGASFELQVRSECIYGVLPCAVSGATQLGVTLYCTLNLLTAD